MLKKIFIFFLAIQLSCISVFSVAANHNNVQPVEKFNPTSLMIGKDCIANCEVKVAIAPALIAEAAWDAAMILIDLLTIAYGFAVNDPTKIADGLISLSMSASAFFSPAVPAGFQHVPKLHKALQPILEAAQTAVRNHRDRAYKLNGINVDELRSHIQSALILFENSPVLRPIYNGIENHTKYIQNIGSNISSTLNNIWNGLFRR